MRLTLRNMLAYLDDFLEPDDTEAIGKKIEESEFATNLVHRIRECTRRLRLGAPQLVGRGLGADPNSVAEYLDHTLAAERVPEFETICLESDVHLAEVSACHQILTLVLGEPAPIHPDSKQRMYQLTAQVDAPPVQSDAMRPPVGVPLMSDGAPDHRVGTRRAKPEVPDYLREPRWRMWPVAAVILIAAFLTIGALTVFAPRELRERALAMFQAAPADQPEIAPETPADAPVTTPPAEATTPAVAPESDAAANAPDAAASETAIEEPPLANADAPIATEPEAATEDTPPVGDRADAPDIAAADNEEMPAAGPGPIEGGLFTSEDALPPAGRTAPAPLAPGALRPAMPTPPRPLDADDGTEPAPPEADAKPVEAPAGVEEPAAEAAPLNFGRNSSSKREVLLKYDTNQKDWVRMASMIPLAKGDRLMSLPSFSPLMTLGSGITIQPEGASLVELVGWTAQNLPIVAIEYGKLLIATTGKPANSLVLQFEDRQIQVTFVDGDAALALDVHRALPPGHDPEAEPAPLTAEMYVTSGLVRLADGELPIDLQGPAQRSLLSSQPQRGGEAEFPKWVSHDTGRGFEPADAANLEPLLIVDRPVGPVLKNTSLHRRREIRTLAIRSLTYLDSFDACIEGLGDQYEKTNWTYPHALYVDDLRAAIARGPGPAAALRSSLERQRKPDSAALYRMLWGYSAEDLKNGADRDLIGALDSDSLDVRVLAFYNLQSITGFANFGYYPEQQASKRVTPVKAWREKLRQGLIVPGAAAASPRGKASGKAGKKAAS